METVFDNEGAFAIGHRAAFRRYDAVDQVINQLAPVGHDEAFLSQGLIVACNAGVGFAGLVVAVNRSIAQQNKLNIWILFLEEFNYVVNVFCNVCLGIGADAGLDDHIIKIAVSQVILVVDSLAIAFLAQGVRNREVRLCPLKVQLVTLTSLPCCLHSR